ncbi:MAG: hypothetical protein JKY28_06250 [Sulfurimonas sp.]|nr:hypothetical protein [Sulfurimonas sp.]
MKYLVLIFVVFFSGCSIKNYETTKTKIIIIKSPKIKFADIGYIRNTNEAIELELFIAGSPVEKITINHLVCIGAGCMSKDSFNEEYLSPFYPSELLQNILLGQAIYKGIHLVKDKFGFEQTIRTQNVDIKYTVDSKTILFKDRKNKILFKIKDTQ